MWRHAPRGLEKEGCDLVSWLTIKDAAPKARAQRVLKTYPSEAMFSTENHFAPKHARRRASKRVWAAYLLIHKNNPASTFAHILDVRMAIAVGHFLIIQKSNGLSCFLRAWLCPGAKLKNIDRNTKISVAQQGKIHRIWHPVRSFPACRESGRCNP